jgi:hypothetical protein
VSGVIEGHSQSPIRWRVLPGRFVNEVAVS